MQESLADQSFHIFSEIFQHLQDGIGTNVCANVPGSQMMYPTVFGDPMAFPLGHHNNWIIGWIAMIFSTHIHVPLRINCNKCGKFPTSPLELSFRN